MATVDFLANARAGLDALADLIGEAADRGQPVGEIADKALALVNDARRAIDTLGDDEGTE